MALVEVTSNDQACTLDTEHTLTTETTDGTYVLSLDLNALASGDILVARIKTKVRSGSTSRIVMQRSFSGVQTDLITLSDPIPVIHEVVFTIEQTDGTGRTVPWSVLRL